MNPTDKIYELAISTASINSVVYSAAARQHVLLVRRYDDSRVRELQLMATVHLYHLQHN